MTGFLIPFLIKWTILLFHQKILFFEYLFVLWMGIQIQSQLCEYKTQGLELQGPSLGRSGRYRVDLEGQIQAGKQGSVGQSVLLGIGLASVLLKRNIGDRQGRAGGECPHPVTAGTVGGFVHIQKSGLLKHFSITCHTILCHSCPG